MLIKHKSPFEEVLFDLLMKSIIKSVLYNLTLKSESYNLNFYPLEVVSRYRDPQLQVGKNYKH